MTDISLANREYLVELAWRAPYERCTFLNFKASKSSNIEKIRTVVRPPYQQERAYAIIYIYAKTMPLINGTVGRIKPCWNCPCHAVHRSSQNLTEIGPNNWERRDQDRRRTYRVFCKDQHSQLCVTMGFVMLTQLLPRGIPQPLTWGIV